MRFLLLFFSLYSSLFGAVHLLSIPKSGTHMIQRALQLLEAGEVKYHHPNRGSYRLYKGAMHKQRGDIFICNIRDPRAILVSYRDAFWNRPMELERKGKGGGQLSHSAVHYPEWKEMSQSARLLEMVRCSGKNPLKTTELIRWGSRLFWECRHLPNVHIFRFEELVGEKGGGSRKEQRAALSRLCTVAGGNPAKIEETMEALFGKSTSFRTGRIDRWKEEFTPAHVAACQKMWTPLIAQWGYPLEY